MKVFSSLLLAIFPYVSHPVGHPVQVPVHVQGIGAGTGYSVTDELTSMKAKLVGDRQVNFSFIARHGVTDS